MLQLISIELNVSTKDEDWIDENARITAEFGFLNFF